MAVKRALYFGCLAHDGHCLYDAAGRKMYDPNKRDLPGFPWDIGHLDTGLLKNGQEPDQITGRVLYTLGGNPLWYAFTWWDRSGDSRGNSCSGFYVCGFDAVLEHYTTGAMQRQRDEAFEYAKSQFPEIAARQRCPLVIVEKGAARPQTDAQWRHL